MMRLDLIVADVNRFGLSIARTRVCAARRSTAPSDILSKEWNKGDQGGCTSSAWAREKYEYTRAEIAREDPSCSCERYLSLVLHEASVRDQTISIFQTYFIWKLINNLQ